MLSIAVFYVSFILAFGSSVLLAHRKEVNTVAGLLTSCINLTELDNVTSAYGKLVTYQFS